MRSGTTGSAVDRGQAHRHLLGAATDVSPELHRAIAGAGPLWFPRRRTTDLAAFLCRSVVGQQLSVAAARTIWSRLETGLATSARALPERCRPEMESTIRACGVSRAKARTLIEIRSADNDGLLARATATREQDERDALLRQIWGVGQWTCDMVSIFFCKDLDVWPEGDVSVRRAFVDLAGDDENGLDEAFRPCRSILALHLYRHLDNPVA